MTTKVQVNKIVIKKLMTEKKTTTGFPYYDYYFGQSAQVNYRGRPQNLLPNWLYDRNLTEESSKHQVTHQTTPQPTDSPTERTSLVIPNINLSTEMATYRPDDSRGDSRRNSIAAPSLPESRLTIDSRVDTLTYRDIKIKVEEALRSESVRRIQLLVSEIDEWLNNEIEYIKTKLENLTPEDLPYFSHRMNARIDRLKRQASDSIFELMKTKRNLELKAREDLLQLDDEDLEEGQFASLPPVESPEQRWGRLYGAGLTSETLVDKTQINVFVNQHTELSQPIQQPKTDEVHSLMRFNSGSNSMRSNGDRQSINEQLNRSFDDQHIIHSSPVHSVTDVESTIRHPPQPHNVDQQITIPTNDVLSVDPQNIGPPPITRDKNKENSIHDPTQQPHDNQQLSQSIAQLDLKFQRMSCFNEQLSQEMQQQRHFNGLLNQQINEMNRTIIAFKSNQELVNQSTDTALAHLKAETSEVKKEVTVAKVKLTDIRTRQEDHLNNTRAGESHLEQMMAFQTQKVTDYLTAMQGVLENIELRLENNARKDVSPAQSTLGDPNIKNIQPQDPTLIPFSNYQELQKQSQSLREQVQKLANPSRSRKRTQPNPNQTSPKYGRTSVDTLLKYGSDSEFGDESIAGSDVSGATPTSQSNKFRADSTAPYGVSTDQGPVRDRVGEALLLLASQHTNRPTQGQLPKLNARDFNGKWEEGEDWLKEFISVAQANNWSDQSRVRQAKHHLKGPAHDWYAQEFLSGDTEIRANADEQIPLWEEFVERFCDYYVPKETRCMAESALYNCRKAYSETYMAYYSRVIKLCNKADPNMTEMRKTFIIKKGITDRNTSQLMAGMETCEEIKRHFQKMDIFNANFDSKPTPTNKRGVSAAQSKIRNVKTPVSTDKQQIDKIKTAVTTEPSRIRCFNCGQTGHLKTQCPKPINKERQRQEMLRKEQLRTGQQFRNEPTVKAMAEDENENPDSDEWIDGEPSADEGQEEDVLTIETQPDESEPTVVNALQLYGVTAEETMTTAQKLKLKNYLTPSITVIVGGQEIKAMVDTGSVITVISTDLANRQPGTTHPWVGNEVKAIEGNSVTPRGYKVIKITYRKQTYDIPMMVMDRAKPPVILGQNFNIKAGLVLDCKKRRISIHPPNKDADLPPDKLGLDKRKQSASVVKQRETDRTEASSTQQFAMTPRKTSPTTDKRLNLTKKGDSTTNKLKIVTKTKSLSTPTTQKEDLSTVRRYKNQSTQFPMLVVKTDKTSTKRLAKAIQTVEPYDSSTDETSSSDSSGFRTFKCSIETDAPDAWDVDGIQRWEDAENKLYGKNYPKLEQYQRFEPFQTKLVNFVSKQKLNGDYLTVTRKRNRIKGWRVEEGVANFESGQAKLLVTNQMPQPRRLFAGKRLVSLRKLQCPPINITTPSDSTPIKPKKKHQYRQERLTSYALTSLDKTIWEEIEREPDPHITLLTSEESEMSDDNPYFQSQTDEEFLSKFNVATDITSKQKYMFYRLFKKYRNCFALEGDNLGRIDVWTHKIETGDAPPVRQNPYRVSAKERQQIEDAVTDMLAKGVIVPNVSSWASPVTLVPKRDGSIRFCVDYRKLNAITKDDVYPIPHLEEPLALMKNSDRFSVMDCDNCYWQIVMDNDSAEKTTFTCHLGTFMFKVMPFGLKCAPASCVRAMDRIFENENRRISFIYMDDLICFSQGVGEQIRRLTILLKRMSAHGLKLKAKKCSFASTSVNYLGHTITVDGICPDRQRVEAVLDKPRPTSIREVKGFLGFTGFYRKFVQSFSKIAEPLLRLMKKDSKFHWGPEQEESFKKLKNILLNPPILAHFNPDLITELRTDASNDGLGAHLIQIGADDKRLLACASRTLTCHEKNYSTTEKECLAIVWAIGKFRPYLYGRHFRIVTDHCGLCFLMHTKDLVNRLARWSLRLMDYDFDIVYNKGDKHGDADYLSRNPFTEEKIKERERDQHLVVYQLFDREQMSVDITSLDKRQIIQKQRNDRMLGPIMQKLEDPTTPRREMRRLTKHYKIVDQVLWHLTHHREAPDESRLAVPKSMILEVLNDAHDKSTAGHFGIRKTLWRVTKHFYWRGYIEDVRNYVKSCKPCQFRKTRTAVLEGWQGSIPVGEDVLRTMSVDLLGPLHFTDNDNKYIITVTDQVSKYAIAIPVNNTLEETIVEQLQIHVFFKFGPPDILISDQGTNLNGRLSKEMYAYWGINHIRTTPYHPQSNGQVENYNHTLAKALAIQIQKFKDQWDKYVYPTTYAYNNTINETTQFSPAELLFGLPPETLLARQLKLGRPTNLDELTIQTKRELAKQRIIKSQQKNKRIVNRHRQPTKIQVGDIVLITKKNLRTQKSGKLEDRWVGPYKVTAMEANQMNCKIRPLQSGQEKVVNLTEVKRYYDRKDFLPVQCHLPTAPSDNRPTNEIQQASNTVYVDRQLKTGTKIKNDRPTEQKQRLPKVKFKA